MAENDANLPISARFSTSIAARQYMVVVAAAMGTA
jgi:hypothetical protein